MDHCGSETVGTDQRELQQYVKLLVLGKLFSFKVIQEVDTELQLFTWTLACD